MFSAVDFKRDKVLELARRLANQTADANSSTAELEAVWKRTSNPLQVEATRVSSVTTLADSDIQVIVELFNQVAGSDLNSDAAFSEQLTEPEQGMLAKMFSKAEVKPLAKMKSYLNQSTGRRLGEPATQSGAAA